MNTQELTILNKHLGSINERGANLFVSSEGSNMCFFKKLDDNVYFQFSFTPCNYPSVESGVIEISEEQLIEHIRTNCGGWFARKCSLDVALSADGYVIEGDD
ncbi:hypothetical protein TUMSATVNIG1_59520 (plasmid) [Vibrio nigripulchritudo]|uniref:hypothetical protein n=1 Tax=Vibrio nigripulchritudo TaxID=28173 RepID=UPI0019095201|nr:hypothetical protein [Vibrio nigripulchritudo]BCL73966.1 hypothetical protein VNTUMSATTG_59030 [Vibrio nigripulchritudo]BDU35343.1 hypothetical protein TUMSATVNIG1_59520 [Vibrio nigripulchritudo]